jgi:hypothetical protein
MKTAEQIIDKIIHSQTDGEEYACLSKQDCLNAMCEYAELKWKQGCEKLLKDIAITFLDGVKKAERESDKGIFQAIADTIQNFPIPNYKRGLHAKTN